MNSWCLSSTVVGLGQRLRARRRGRAAAASRSPRLARAGAKRTVPSLCRCSRSVRPRGQQRLHHGQRQRRGVEPVALAGSRAAAGRGRAGSCAASASYSGLANSASSSAHRVGQRQAAAGQQRHLAFEHRVQRARPRRGRSREVAPGCSCGTGRRRAGWRQRGVDQRQQVAGEAGQQAGGRRRRRAAGRAAVGRGAPGVEQRRRRASTKRAARGGVVHRGWRRCAHQTRRGAAAPASVAADSANGPLGAGQRGDEDQEAPQVAPRSPPTGRCPTSALLASFHSGRCVCSHRPPPGTRLPALASTMMASFSASVASTGCPASSHTSRPSLPMRAARSWARCVRRLVEADRVLRVRHLLGVRLQPVGHVGEAEQRAGPTGRGSSAGSCACAASSRRSR